MNKFTPGPWELSENKMSLWAISPLNARVRIAEIRKHSPLNGIDYCANADLIAASPELYQTLIDLLEHAETQSEAVGFSRADTAIYNRCRAVLAQARGEK